MSDETKLVVSDQTIAAITEIKESGDTITDVNNQLIEMMKIVKNNPDAIKQAQVMSNLAGQIMNGLKVKVAAANLVVRTLKK